VRGELAFHSVEGAGLKPRKRPEITIEEGWERNANPKKTNTGWMFTDVVQEIKIHKILRFDGVRLSINI